MQKTHLQCNWNPFLHQQTEIYKDIQLPNNWHKSKYKQQYYSLQGELKNYENDYISIATLSKEADRIIFLVVPGMEQME